MNNSFIQEAFRDAILTEDVEELALDAMNPDDTESFLDVINNTEDDEMISDVYDLEAEAKEDLKQSYIGKVILDCNVCHSNVFFDKEEITQDEDGICCTEVECPYCMSNEGYTIIGEVKPYQEEEDVDIEDIETEDVPEEEEVDIEIEAEEPEDEEELKEGLKESIDPSFLEEQEMYKAKDGVNWIVYDIDFDEDSVVAFKAYADGDFNEDEEYEFSVNEFCNMITGLAEGLKADEVKELRGDEEINGADGPLKAVDELEGSDEIRGPKYSELNEGWMPINKISRYKNVADEYQVNEKINVRNAKTGKDLEYSTSNGGYNDLKVTVKTKNGKTTSVAKEVLADEIDILKSENLGKSPFTIKENCEQEEVEEGLLGTVGGGIAGAALGSAVGHPVLGAVGGALAGNAIQNHFTDDKNESLEECGDPEAMEEGVAGWAAGRTAGQAAGTAIGSVAGPAGAAVGRVVGGAIGGKLGSAAQDKFLGDDDQKLHESIEDVQVSTEDETMTMTTKEDGGVVIETSPKDDEFVEEPAEEWEGEEMIAPLEPETEMEVEDAIDVNNEDEEELPEDEMLDEIPEEELGEEEPEENFEEFDEESFNDLGESYLKRCYENVTSFKTSNITLNENKEFIIEGKIGFDSGNEKDTQFIFTPKISDNGKLKLEGYNKQISKGKKTFKLNCSINDKALVCESLNYNYKGKNDLNESVRVYGTVKRK